MGIRPLIARRGTEHGSGLGMNRWVVEAAFALLRWFRRLHIRWEIRAAFHQTFLTLGCAIICCSASKSSADLSPQPEPATSASPSGVRR